MIEALQRPRPEVRAAVSQALGVLGCDAEFAAEALKGLLDDEQPSVRSSAEIALQEIRRDTAG